MPPSTQWGFWSVVIHCFCGPINGRPRRTRTSCCMRVGQVLLPDSQNWVEPPFATIAIAPEASPGMVRFRQCGGCFEGVRGDYAGWQQTKTGPLGRLSGEGVMKCDVKASKLREVPRCKPDSRGPSRIFMPSIIPALQACKFTLTRHPQALFQACGWRQTFLLNVNKLTVANQPLFTLNSAGSTVTRWRKSRWRCPSHPGRTVCRRRASCGRTPQ